MQRRFIYSRFSTETYTPIVNNYRRFVLRNVQQQENFSFRFRPPPPKQIYIYFGE